MSAQVMGFQISIRSMAPQTTTSCSKRAKARNFSGSITRPWASGLTSTEPDETPRRTLGSSSPERIFSSTLATIESKRSEGQREIQPSPGER